MDEPNYSPWTAKVTPESRAGFAKLMELSPEEQARGELEAKLGENPFPTDAAPLFKTRITERTMDRYIS